MKVICHRCKKEWEYVGDKNPKDKYPQYVTCTNCRTSVKLKEEFLNAIKKAKPREIIIYDEATQ